MGYYGDPKENVLISPFNGLVFTDVKEPRLQEVRWPATYHVQIKSLRLFGDPSSENDYEVWRSPAFHVSLIDVKSNYTGPGKELLQF
ncbi:hypothetical protein EV182_008909 [Spiromyces aspiralis]|uniref:Uncharacterized protein n=1 Tax=Spiromyces aspiralis TaxID=68401 RepID=A0ACC1HHX3_9FUNG|nr:hypothetical protein EV182_008909 [Spiromyces aspiralis]